LDRLLVRPGFVSELTAPPVLTATPGAVEEVAPDDVVPDDVVPDDVDGAVDSDVDVDVVPSPGVGESLAEFADEELADDELAGDESAPESADVSAAATPQP